MKKEKYINEPLQLGKRVKDFLPAPSQLMPKEDKIQVTLSLNNVTVEFFKNKAKGNNASYQCEMQDFLEQYTKQQTNT